MNTLEVTIKGDQGAGKTTLHEIIKNGLQECGFVTKEYEKDIEGVYVGEINAQSTQITIIEHQTSWIDRLVYRDGKLVLSVDNLVLFLQNHIELKSMTDPIGIALLIKETLGHNFRIRDIQYALAYVEKQKCS